MNSFSQDIAKFVEKCGVRSDLAVRKIVMDVGNSVIEKSPVGDPSLWASPAPKGYTGGHFRANWQLNEGSVPTGEVDAIDEDGADTMARALTRLPNQAAGKVFYWGNNLPYAQALEDGHSKQAPMGMVSLTRREFMTYVRDAVKAAQEGKP